jgi:hypothetical protein
MDTIPKCLERFVVLLRSFVYFRFIDIFDRETSERALTDMTGRPYLVCAFAHAYIEDRQNHCNFTRGL